MPVIPEIAAFHEDLTALRHDLHAHPELGFEERRTAAIVAEKLKSWGVTVHAGIGRTGIVGVLDGARPGPRTIGLRADMDALAMEETSGLPFASTHPGRFHGCGHDGHTTMLLGAARYLAETRDFAGRVLFIFQPAEEGAGGARAMLADGLFERFACDELYGMHNWPTQKPGTVMVKPGPAMAGADFFDIRIKGKGCHGAMPQMGKDPVVAVAAMIQALQTVVARNVAPTETAVLSITRVEAGSAYNVVPDEALLSGTIRFFDTGTAELIRHRMKTVVAGLAAGFEIEAEVTLRPIYDVLVNDETLSWALLDAAAKVVGPDLAIEKDILEMGSEDFSDMLRRVPGAYCTLGHGEGAPGIALHNPKFGFDDSILPVGASLYARIALDRLGA